jgi:hypothetical protein
MGVAIPMPHALPSVGAQRRLRRLRSLAWLLDRSIPLGRWRIGLDPIIGLLPGAGDWIGAVLSLYVLYEGARLGVPAGVLGRMGGNILVETIFGSIPVLGDLFDFAWQANTKNLALVEQHYRPTLEPRSAAKMWLIFGIIVLLVLGLLVGLAIVVVRVLQRIFS